jgi:NAD(P)H dehydrogenase (quinone)
VRKPSALSTDHRRRFPAGTQAATTAASLGARVTLVEKDIVGGAAHLWDCIPSKTMAATAIRITSIRNAVKLGLVADRGKVDPAMLADPDPEISSDITTTWVELLNSQNVEILAGTGPVHRTHTAR